MHEIVPRVVSMWAEGETVAGRKEKDIGETWFGQ